MKKLVLRPIKSPFSKPKPKSRPAPKINKRHLPLMPELRVQAEKLGLDITGFGMKRTAIDAFIRQVKADRGGFVAPSGRGFVKRSPALGLVILKSPDDLPTDVPLGCQVCGSKMKRRIRTSKVFYKEYDLDFDQPEWYCRNCREVILGPSDIDVADKAYLQLKAMVEEGAFDE